MKKVLFLFVIALSILVNTDVKAQYVTTFAGTGTASFGGDGGAALSATMNTPSRCIFDAAGNMYIADATNNRVRKVTTSTGIITTVAGSGTAGFSGDGSAATAANLNSPTGLALDGAGDLYIADLYNHRIRKVTLSTGIITTVAGSNTTGAFAGDGGAATSARLNGPFGIAFDAAGDLFIADQNNHRIRRVNMSTGIISTFAGSATSGYTGDGGAATSATLSSPAGVSIDAAGNVYIADYFNNAIRMVEAGTGNIITAAGTGSTGYSGDGGAATSARLAFPTDVAFDGSGDFFIADLNNHVVRRVDVASGNISTFVGSNTAGFNGDCNSPSTADLNLPMGIAFNAAGALYIADRGNNRIRFVQNPCSGTPSGGTIAATATDGCNTYSTTLTLSGASVGCDIAYQWQSSTDGTSFSNVSGATNMSYTTTITSGVYYRAVVTCTATGTFYAGTSLYLAVSRPLVISNISGPTSVCAGSTITLTDTATSGSWYVTNGNASITAGGVLTGLFAGLDTVIYRATNLCGAVADSHVVTINPIVTPAISLTVSPSITACSGSTITFTPVPVNGGSAPVYTWIVNGTLATTGTTAYTFNPGNTDSVAVILNSNVSCSTTRLAYGNIRMNMTPLVTPTIAVSDAPWGDSVCLGESVNFTTTITGGGSAPTYQWSVNGINTTTGSTFTRIPADGDVIACTLTSNQFCASPTTASASRTMTVSASQTPFVSISSNVPGDTACSGNVVTFSANWRYGGTAPLIRWRKNGIYVATGPSYSYVPAVGDSIQCLLFSNSPCRTADSVYSNVRYMNILPNLTAALSITATPGTTFNAGQLIGILAATVNVGTTPTYQWYLNGSLVAGATSAIYSTDSLNNGDVVYCRVFSSYYCSTPSILNSNSLVFTLRTTGIADMQLSLDNIKLLPNPNSGSFEVVGSVGGYNANSTIAISNMLGQTVSTTQATIENGILRSQVQLDPSMTNGIYMLTITVGEERRVMRFVLSK